MLHGILQDFNETAWSDWSIHFQIIVFFIRFPLSIRLTGQ